MNTNKLYKKAELLCVANCDYHDDDEDNYCLEEADATLGRRTTIDATR